MTRRLTLLLPAALSVGAAFFAFAQEPAPAQKPLKALLVIGGCCHDYGKQKDLLKAGLEEKLNISVDICYSDSKGTAPVFTCYEKADWAAGYDVIIHDECAADIKDLAVVNRILDAHRNGVPAVNLHCAMHSYRTAPDVGKKVESGSNDSLWFDYLGLQSSGHGPQKPITITYSDHAVTKGLKTWTTVNEELYNNILVHDTTVPLAKGKQGDSETVVAWSHEYGAKKTRVFSTTIGHNNETIADEKYLDLVSRGLLWSVGKLDADGKPAAGYAHAAK